MIPACGPTCGGDIGILATDTDLTLILPDRVGTLAQTLGLLGRAGINIAGHSGFPAWAGEGILHLIVDDAERARTVLHDNGIEVREERRVLIVSVDHQPGALAARMATIAGAGVNIDLTYSLADGRVVIGVNEPDRALAVLEAADRDSGGKR